MQTEPVQRFGETDGAMPGLWRLNAEILSHEAEDQCPLS